MYNPATQESLRFFLGLCAYVTNATAGPVPQPAASATKLLRSARTHLPPPKARSPMKTTLGSSPRRQSSMGPRVQPSTMTSSPSRANSHPVVSRRLDFEQDESSLQETPALSGSGQRRGQRRSVYSIEPSPTRLASSAMMEETIQEEIIAGEESSLFNGVMEESGLQEIENDAVLGAEVDATGETDEHAAVDMSPVTDGPMEEEPEVVHEPVKEPTKRGRKRKSDATEPRQIDDEPIEPRKRGRKPLEKKDKNTAVELPRRSKRVSDISVQDTSTVHDASAGAMEDVKVSSVVKKPRGRPPKQPAQSEMLPPPAKKQKRQTNELEQESEKPDKTVEPSFKKPKAAPKSKKKADVKEKETQLDSKSIGPGKLVDVHGHPISKADLDQMSTTTTGTRFGRGRHLSVFRELEPDSAATIGRLGRHRVKPINFWANEAVSYDAMGSMQAIVNRVFEEPPPTRNKKQGRAKAKYKSYSVAAEEDEEVDIQPWEEEGDGEFKGQFKGPYKGYDAANKVSTNKLITTSKRQSSFAITMYILILPAIAWSEKGIKPKDIPDGSFKFIKLASGHVDDDDPTGKTFMSWGFLELEEHQMKRAKNASSMHMVFYITSGAVEVRVHENVLIVRHGGVFQVPRGKSHCQCPLLRTSTTTCSKCRSCATVVVLSLCRMAVHLCQWDLFKPGCLET